MLSSQSTTLRASSPAWARRLVPSAVALPACGPVVVALLVLAHLPLLAIEARQTWAQPHYSFFLLVPIGAAVLGFRAARRLSLVVPGSDRAVAWLLGSSWALLAAACLTGSAWLGTVAAMSVILAVVYALGGSRLLRALLPAWGLLWLAIPPPLGLDGDVVTMLQALASRWSSPVLDMLGVFHLREGNVIRLADRQVLIAEACSGIHSLFAVLAGTIFLVLWARRSLVRGIVLVATAVIWVFLGNIARIVAVVYVAERWHNDMSTGWPHEALGVLVFGLALGLTASTDSLFSLPARALDLLRTWAQAGLLGPDDALAEVYPSPPPAPPTVLPPLRSTRLASWPLAGAYGVLVLAQPLLIGTRLADQLLPGPVLASRMLALRVDDLLSSSGPFQRQGLQTERREFGNTFGRYSKRWMYRWGNREAIVSLDGPFLGWHELTGCYISQGWTCRNRSVEPGAAGEGAVAAARLEGPPGRTGDLLFSLFDDRGLMLKPENPGDRWAIIRDRLAFWASSSQSRTYQVQLFVPGTVPLTSAEREQALAFFRQVRSQLIEKIDRRVAEASS